MSIFPNYMIRRYNRPGSSTLARYQYY